MWTSTEWPSNSASRYLPKGPWKRDDKDLFKNIHGVRFIEIKTLKQPVNRKNRKHMYMTEYYSARKRNKSLMHVTAMDKPHERHMEGKPSPRACALYKSSGGGARGGWPDLQTPNSAQLPEAGRDRMTKGHAGTCWDDGHVLYLEEAAFV